MAPFGGVEGGPAESIKARQRRCFRHRELAAGGDQDVGLMGTGARLERPGAPLLVPTSGGHLSAGADLLQHPETPRDTFDVRLDLGLGRVTARPAVGREGELVEVRRDVAGSAGVGVGVPDPANAIGLLEDCDVLVALATKRGRGPDAAEAAADDCDRTATAHTPKPSRP